MTRNAPTLLPRRPPEVRKRCLSPARQRLVELMQELWFGHIYNLVLRQGEPVMSPLPKYEKHIKFGSTNEPPATLPTEDYVLPHKIVQLLSEMDTHQNGTLSLLEVQAGLPYRTFIQTND
jgi:hypothetical protein